jgi:hypothetical protein
MFIPACILALHLTCSSSLQDTYHVAPNGNDAWSGTLAMPNAGRTDGPFLTISRALEAARIRRAEQNEPAPVIIQLAPGDHIISQSIELAQRDSGSDAAPLIIQGAPDHASRLLGGRKISGFLPISDPVFRGRLDPAVRDRVLVANLKDQGITNFGSLRSRGFSRPAAPAALELFCAGRPMTLARWPNEGEFSLIAGIPQGSGSPDGHGGTIGNLEKGFLFSGDHPSRWQFHDNIWVHGYWAWDWANSYERILRLDPSAKLILTAPPYGLYGFRKDQRIFFQNILEELDQPGEWFLDHASGNLFFMPPTDLAGTETLVSLLENPFFNVSEANHVIIQNLVFEAARGHGVVIAGGHAVEVRDCILKNLGNDAVRITGGADHVVAHCSITQTGDGGISLSGGNRKALTPAGHHAEDNHIHHIARWSKCYVPAIGADGVGITIAHNLIHHHPHCAILFGGNNHTIAFNEIHHVALETGDVGAIYTGRDYTYRGNRILHNYIHHTGGVGMGSMGVYMDDCVSGTEIRGNIFHKVQRAVFLGGGRDFQVANNIFLDCNPAIALDGRGLDKSPVWHDMIYQTMKPRFEAMNPLQPPYSDRYPELKDLPPFLAADQGVPPGNITIARNISLGGPWLEIGWHATPDAVHLENNLIDADPRFLDSAKPDFRLLPDSPALKLGFEPIPVDQIGPRTRTRPAN